MSQITTSHLIIPMFMAILLAGCGDKNDKASFSADSGHSSDWISVHKTSAKANPETCAECHGENFTGGIVKVGCFSTPQMSFNGFACHATNPVVSLNCSSCHGATPNGTAAPNRAGAHAKHVALSGVTCATCHDGGGAGTATHGKIITVSALPDSFKAKLSTSFGYNAADGTCSGVICHGGQKTPKWDTAVAISCIQCHEQGTASAVPQYNSFYSGQSTNGSGATVNLHNLHSLANIPGSPSRIACTHCHSAKILTTGHFNGLTTPVFEAPAAGTVGGSGTLITNYVPYSSSVPSGSCTSACHNIFNNNPRNWVNP